VKSHKAWNWLIVLATLSLVFAPVTADQFRLEVARWLLASATNNVPNDLQMAEERVEQATQWADDITDLRDFWLYKTQRAIAEARAERLGFELSPSDASPEQPLTELTMEDQPQLTQDADAAQDSGAAQQAAAMAPQALPPTPPGDVSGVIQQAIARNPANYTLGLIYASNQLFESALFAEAVEVMEVSCVGSLRKNPGLLNQLAYFRALASIELDIALRDINEALSSMPDNDALRDTRAWVLFQMGKPLEALPDANFAVESISRPRGEGFAEQFLRWLEQILIGRPEPRSSDQVLTRREAGIELWGMGALYFHRARILEALGRVEQAEADFQWLRDHRLPTDSRLY
jgi:tetratricopeptide (TPR) repeat protein